MRYWIGTFMFCLATKQYAYAENLVNDNQSNQSITAIFLAVIILIIIFFILIRRQKRRFND